MKNFLTLVLALAVVSAPAYASRARLESLGEAKNGSYYIDDSRNIFLNPAQIVHYKKKLFLELGTNLGGTATAGAIDKAYSDRGQGGFTNTFGDFTYGVYINNDSERTLKITNFVNGFFAKNFLAPANTVEFFLGGEGATNWGFSAWYGGNDRNLVGGEQRASQVAIRLGVDMNNLQVFSTVGLLSKSENDTTSTNKDVIKGRVGIDAGVTYKMNDMTYYGKFVATGADYGSDSLGTTSAVQIRNTQWGIGSGWKKEMTKSTNLFSRISFDMTKESVNTTDVKTYNMPLVVGAEAQAMSWLAIRGSIASSLFGQTYTSNTAVNRMSLAGYTTVSAGVGMTFGDVVIDGLVASDGSSNPANGVSGFGTAPQANTTFGFGNGMLGRLALSYNF